MHDSFGQPTPTSKLVHRLRLMADSGGMLSKDRIRALMEAADRLEELDELVSIMTETEVKTDEKH